MEVAITPRSGAIRVLPALFGCLLLSAAPAPAETAAEARVQQLREEARGDLQRYRNRWARLELQQVAVRERFEVLSLLPREIYERAFQMLEDPTFAARVVAYREARTGTSGGPGGEGGGAPGAGAAPGTAGASSASTLPPEFLVLLQEHKPELWARIRAQLLARIRGQIKKQALHSGIPYQGVPLLGLHPYQVYLLTGPVAGSDDLALPLAMARLRAVFAAPGVSRPAEALARCFQQRDRLDMVAGFALYRVLRAEPGLDARAVEGALEVLKSFFMEGDRPGMPADPGRLLFASLHDMLDTLRLQGSAEAAATVLFATLVDFQMGILGLQNRIQAGAGGPEGGGLPGTAAERVRTMLTLDDLLGGHTLLPAQPAEARRVEGSPFQLLDPLDHLTRLSRFFHARVLRARALRDRVREKMAQYAVAAPGQRPRLVSDIERLVHGREPPPAAPDSLRGLIASEEFAAERRSMLWLGVPATPGGHEAFHLIFGDPASRPPRPGEVEELRTELESTILPFLRDRREERHEIDPRDPEELAPCYQELDRLAGRIGTIDQQLGLADLDPGSRARLAEERSALVVRLEQGIEVLRSPDPLARLQDYRGVQEWLRSGKGPDGRSLGPEDRLLLQRELVRLEREMYPDRAEAVRRQAELAQAWLSGTDLRGHPAGPEVLDALREEQDRMGAIARGAPPGLPPGARPEDRLPTSRPPEDRLGVPDPGRAGGAPGSGALPVAAERPEALPVPPGPPAGAGASAPGTLQAGGLDARVLALRTRWLATNGENPWGFPPYAPAEEIRQLIDVAIRKRMGPGSARGLSGDDCGREAGGSGPPGATGAGGDPARRECSDEGKYAFWLEVRDPGMRQEITRELEKLHAGRLAEFRAKAEAELGASGSGPKGSPAGTGGGASPPATPGSQERRTPSSRKNSTRGPSRPSG